jgi:hypothetical protein
MMMGGDHSLGVLAFEYECLTVDINDLIDDVRVRQDDKDMPETARFGYPK